MVKAFGLEPKSLGNLSEELAVAHLKKNGYKIIKTNYRTRVGEIDIVAQGDGYIVFVEVKARKSQKYGLPQEAVTQVKQRVIRKVASAFLQENSLQDVPVRFDVMAITFSADKKPHIEHIPFAF